MAVWPPTVRSFQLSARTLKSLYRLAASSASDSAQVRREDFFSAGVFSKLLTSTPVIPMAPGSRQAPHPLDRFFVVNNGAVQIDLLDALFTGRFQFRPGWAINGLHVTQKHVFPAATNGLEAVCFNLDMTDRLHTR